ncbi:hypothetical protein KJ909_03825 [Patescibacteria group bacterium]|nr:hypothetical protein [Patescibacteria group bacterium]
MRNGIQESDCSIDQREVYGVFVSNAQRWIYVTFVDNAVSSVNDQIKPSPYI